MADSKFAIQSARIVVLDAVTRRRSTASRPVLSALAPRPVALLQTPQVPSGLGPAYIGLSLERVVLVRAPKSSDALWSAEQILRTGTRGALIYWSQYIQASSLRRLHLAAQSSETLFVMVRPLAAAQDASPAVLRLAVRPLTDGLIVDIVKRRGPAASEPISVPLQPTPVLLAPRRRVVARPLEEVDQIPDAVEPMHA